MAEIAIQLEVFNALLERWTIYFFVGFSLLLLLGLSVLAFWRFNAVLFMLTGGASMAFGLFWFDVFTTNFGFALSLMLMAYSLVCFGFGFRCMFWREFKIEE